MSLRVLLVNPPVFTVNEPWYDTPAFGRIGLAYLAGLLTKNWDDYNKQIGGALEFANLSRPRIEILQLWAYVKVFLWNFRLLDLSKFVWEYRSAGWAIVKRIVSGVLWGESRQDETPEERGVVHAEVIAKATERWQAWEVSELVRAKKDVPHERVEYRDKLKQAESRR